MSEPVVEGMERLFRLEEVSRSPVRIASLELIRSGSLWFVRSRSTDGAEGLALTNGRIAYLYPILQQLVIPYFNGKDARDLELLVDGVYLHQANYKLAGLALWCCAGYVEASLLDLLGKVARRLVADLLGGALRHEIPV